MIKKRKVLPVYIVAVSMSLSVARAESAGGLAWYLAEAKENNPRLAAARAQWQAGLAQVGASDALPDPNLSIGYFFEEVETRVGPQQQKFGVRQQFPWAGTRSSREDAARAGADALRAQVVAQELSVAYEVKAAFYEYRYLKQALDITRENIELIKHLEQVAQARILGGAPTTAAIQAQVELGKLDDRLSTFTAMREPLVARLNAAINAPSDTPQPWPEEVQIHTPLALNRDGLLEQLRSNPQIEMVAAHVRKEEANISLAKKARYPTITVGVDYIVTDDALDPGMAGSGKDPVMGVVAFTVPLWPGKNRARIAVAQAERTAAEAQLNDAVNALESSLKMALFNYEDAARKQRLYRDTLIPQARQSLKIAEEAYAAGKVEFINLIDAERLLLMFQLGLEKAEQDLEIGKARIEMMTAKEWDHE
jgi:outer membrane protein TolC